MRTEFNSNSNVSFYSLYDGFFKKLPNKDIKNSAGYNKLGNALASPHWNRAALGVAAITTQPAFDYFNPKVDKDTATTSALRTIAKISVCTSVGFCVRGMAYKLADKYVHASQKDGSTIFTPKEILKEKNAILKAQKLKLHKNTLSTVLALGVMLFTNFLLDAPLTTIAANKLIEKYTESSSKEVKVYG